MASAPTAKEQGTRAELVLENIELGRFACEEGSAVPLPGSGNTKSRFDTLIRFAKIDLSLARLVEGHLDALAILAEAGGPSVESRATYGVWAARSGATSTHAVRSGGGWVLSGTKPFCSGAALLDRALVTADTADGYRMFDVDLRLAKRITEPGSWPAVGMAASASETFVFEELSVATESQVGGPEFYTHRPGFWFGAAGVAACWFGGALGLTEHLVGRTDSGASPHTLAALGRSIALVETMRTSIYAVADEIDSDPFDSRRRARLNALTVRQVVHDLSAEVLSLTAEAGGASPLCHDAAQSRRAADLYVYLAQHHGNKDAAELGSLILQGRDAIPG